MSTWEPWVLNKNITQTNFQYSNKKVKFCSPLSACEMQKGTKARTTNPTRRILHDFTATQTGKKVTPEAKVNPDVAR